MPQPRSRIAFAAVTRAAAVGFRAHDADQDVDRRPRMGPRHQTYLSDGSGHPDLLRREWKNAPVKAANVDAHDNSSHTMVMTRPANASDIR